MSPGRDHRERRLAQSRRPRRRAFHGENFLEAVSSLVRATIASPDAASIARALEKIGIETPVGDAEALLARARGRLPDLARWLEENGRELLETA